MGRPILRMMKLLIALLATLYPLSCQQSSAADPARRPAVLLVGDEVTAQYAGHVRDLLEDRINVDYLATPTGANPDVDDLVAQIAAVQHDYDRIYLAYGLDATRAIDEKDSPDDTGKSAAAVSVGKFMGFLEKLAQKTRATQTRFIWATIVPVTENMPAHRPVRVETYNAVIRDMAYNRQALLLDLHEYVRIRRDDMQMAGDYRLTDMGARLLASVVAEKIEEVLEEGNAPDLPHVLVLGDSIANQYSTFLRQKLQRQANVRIGGTCFACECDWAAIVRRAVADGEREIGKPFALIQFNWGLHALKWVRGDDFSMTPQEGFTRCCPPERYAAELETLVVELKKTGRPLLWATTTPANNGSQPDDALAYNAIALEIMRKHDVPVNDLNGFVTRESMPMQGCHFPRNAAEALGTKVAEEILHKLSRAASVTAPGSRSGR